MVGVTVSSRLSDRLTWDGLRSQPMPRRPCDRAACRVVPLPRKLPLALAEL
jgi:hypothetical protein